MNNLIVVPSKKEDINIILDKDIKGIILGVKNLSIYELELDIDEIINIASSTDKEVIIAMNKMIHNDDLILVRKVLSKVINSNIKKVLFYDLGIYNVIKDSKLDIEMIISQEHLNASTLSNDFYYKRGIKNSLITSDITYDEVLEINSNSKMNIYYTAYGYLPIFYSRRYLLTNYFKYIKQDKEDNKYYIFNNELKYMIREFNYGTIIYSPLVNLLGKIKNNSINYVIDLSFNNDINVIDRFINNEDDNGYTGFFDTKTIYKLRGDKNA